MNERNAYRLPSVESVGKPLIREAKVFVETSFKIEGIAMKASNIPGGGLGAS
jgi:hypothetical protein